MATRPDNLPIQERRRRYPRTRVVWPATLRTAVGSFDCLVLDLSANGAKIQFSVPPGEIEGLVMLAIPRLPGFNATVAWTHPDHGMELGLTFDDPPEEVAALLTSVLPNSSAVRFSADDESDTGADQDGAGDAETEERAEDDAPTGE